MVSVRNLKKYFGTQRAVDGITFELNSGDIIGFLGSNGAGKTTTMRLLSGYLTPDSGSISIEGIDPTVDPVKVKRLIGYLPENNPLYKDMLVSEFFYFIATLKGIPSHEIESAIDFVVSSVSVEEVFNRPIRELSKGFKQRVGMAAAIINHPKVLIMDEPTEGLDPSQRLEIRSLIQRLSKDRSIIMSTHVMQEASAICNRVLIIHQGRLKADGTAIELCREFSGKETVEVCIEGEGVVDILVDSFDEEELSIISHQDNKIDFYIYVEDMKNIGAVHHKISSLSASHQWVIWKLTQKRRNLEDVFNQIVHNSTKPS